MKVGKSGHLSYCTNIHSGESWSETFDNLKLYLLGVKAQISKKNPFGIGLRLSNQAAIELNEKTTLASFKKWLKENNLYVFTINGFPYGNFHDEVIKDKVHVPDWSTNLRKEYTLLLFNILAVLVPENLISGISTSPITYKYWHTSKSELEKIKNRACEYLIDVVNHLINIKNTTGKSMHLNIEPEPDGLIENSEEFITFFNDFLLKRGGELLVKKNKCSIDEAQSAIREHIQLCYDVCHFSVGFEKPLEIIEKMKNNGIRIGKLQISAALKCTLNEHTTIEELKSYLKPFHEPNYLHQAVIKSRGENFSKYTDLDMAINAMHKNEFEELRTHYHVPVFLDEYQNLKSTQDDLIDTLQLWKEDEFTQHLEIETYTWEVLPNKMQTDIISAITREINWVRTKIGDII
ncbi:metabolite traffic protein EboE [Aquimarina agarilytica]|uniref:metabolite traffic protein EboE n=1 Tax=Aquimarina agarilytica TaxID=1087449 RepID=UPI0002883A4D|nr:metabolite traffic protein EboE [Aquimarina agarilytica]